MRPTSAATTRAAEGVARLRELLGVAKAAAFPRAASASTCRSPAASITTPARSTKRSSLDLPDIGSVCSGGRYDNLAGLYTKQKLPGVGASLGLDRLLAAMEELDLLPKVATPAPVLIVQFDADRLGDYQQMAPHAAAAGIGVEVYPEAKKVGQQLKYAERARLPRGADRRPRRVRAGRVEGQGSRQSAKRKAVADGGGGRGRAARCWRLKLVRRLAAPSRTGS